MNANEKASLILAERRRINKVQQDKRIDEVYKKIPQIKAIYELIKETGFNSLKLAACKMDTKANEEKIKNLKREKDKLLVENGFKPDYMELKYHHELCKDTGFIGTEPCSCRKNLIIEDNYEKSGLRAAINRENFSTFNYNLFSKNPYMGLSATPYDNIVKIVGEIKDYINNRMENTPNNNNNIYMEESILNDNDPLVNNFIITLLNPYIKAEITKLYKSDMYYCLKDVEVLEVFKAKADNECEFNYKIYVGVKVGTMQPAYNNLIIEFLVTPNAVSTLSVKNPR